MERFIEGVDGDYIHNKPVKTAIMVLLPLVCIALGVANAFAVAKPALGS